MQVHVYHAFKELNEDASVKAIIITGSGEKAFVAGADIAEFTDFTNAPCYAGQSLDQGCVTAGGASFQSLNGKKLPLSPDTSFTISSRYDFPINEFSGHIYLAYNRQSEVEGDLNNPSHSIDSYGLLNGKIGLLSPSGKYSMSLWAKILLMNFMLRAFSTHLEVDQVTTSVQTRNAGSV